MPDLGNTSVFSQTDASNGSGTQPSWLGSAAPSTLDDAGRALQGAVFREWNWRNYTVTATGTGTAFVLTYSVAPAAYYNGQRFGFIAIANSGSVTLNVNGLGAKTIKRVAGGSLTALILNDILAGAFVEVAYNLANDCFVLVNRLGLSSDIANTFTADQSLVSNTDNKPQLSVINASATVSSGPYTILARSRGTYTSPSVVAVGDNLGGFLFQGYDGTGLLPAASVTATVDAAPGVADMPGRLVFSTTSDGAAVSTERMRIDSSGNVLVNSTGGLGYGTGSGGTVTQATSKVTGVTLNKTNGTITTAADALAAGATAAFIVTNSTVAATDVVLVNSQGPSYSAYANAIGAGSFKIQLTNITAGSLSAAVNLNFAVIKAVNT